MSTEAHKALVARFYDEVFNRHNLSAIDALLAPDILDHGAIPGQAGGAEGVRQTSGMLLAAFPDLALTLEDQVAEDDKVVTRWTAHGTHREVFLGIAPTGTKTTTAGISVDRVFGGQIVERWLQWDRVGVLQQLGALPTHGGPSAAPKRAGTPWSRMKA